MREEPLDARSAREAELVEVLSSYVEPRAVSYRFVVAFVVLGLLACVGVAWTASQARMRPPVRFEPRAHETLARGVAAFERGHWDESERLLLAARESGQVPTQRLEDYLERLALVRRDSERLVRAEEALNVDEPERALALTALITANSVLFPQAEVLGRAARARAAQLAANKQAAGMQAAREASPAEMESDSSVPSSEPALQKKPQVRRTPRTTAAPATNRGGDADW